MFSPDPEMPHSNPKNSADAGSPPGTEASPSETGRRFEAVYDALRDLAAHWLDGEGPGHTLEPSALVNEAYLRLAGTGAPSWRDDAHFFAVAARCLRRILVDHARGKKASKRGRGWERITLSGLVHGDADDDASLDLVALDAALDRLAQAHERPARVVELRYFGGATLEETAEALGISTGTVKADWRFARAWLGQHLE